MFNTASRRLPALPPLAAAVYLCFGAIPVLAQAQTAAVSQTLAPVVITGARFDSDPALLPIGATIISAEQISRAGVTDVNAAIRRIGGVYGRQSFDGSPDFSLDLRGFGVNSSQNMVVVLDGVRLSENEQSNALLSTIPIDTVERIEITRGGSSVLYGEGATGGVISIVTKRPGRQQQRGSVAVEAGQLGSREARATLVRSWDAVALDATLASQRSDNDRANNRFEQTHFSGGAQWFAGNGRVGVRLDSARQDSRMPGALSEAQYQSNPHQSLTPNDFGSLDSDRLSAFGSQRFGNYDVAAELSRRQKTARSTLFFGGLASPAEYQVDQTQFTPRVRSLGEVAGLLNEVVAGVDLAHWSRATIAGFSQARATQRSQAFYLRDELRFDAAREGRLAVGVRRELFDKQSFDPAPYTSANYGVKQGLNAWDIQASMAPLALLSVYAKAGQSYRLANADENGYTPNFNVPLKPQTSHDLELGGRFGDGAASVSARLFRHNLRDEIFFDPTLNFGYGYNTNLAPTRRQGVELDAEANLTPVWRVSGHYQHVQAEFTEGANRGLEMVLVPRNVLTARLAWLPGDGQSAELGAQWVDRQRYGDDFSNNCSGQMPSFATFDARYARTLGAWEVALSGLNLGDKQYFSEAYRCKGGIYPSNGRQLKLSARYAF